MMNFSKETTLIKRNNTNKKRERGSYHPKESINITASIYLIYIYLISTMLASSSKTRKKATHYKLDH